MGNTVRLSAVIITYNEENKIGHCLDTILPVADEIVVVDSDSTDRTREICRSKGARVVEQSFLGYVEQKNFALDRASFDHVLALDADERLSEQLQASIQAVKRTWTADGFLINRRNRYYDRWIRHSGVYPDRKLRLWDRRKGRWGSLNPHDKVLMRNGAIVTRLDGDLLHDRYDSIAEHVNQSNRFSTISARAYFDAGRRSSLFHVLARPAFRFVLDYFFRGGVLDGFPGLMVCAINAQTTFLKYAKLRAIEKSDECHDRSREG